MCSKNGTRWAAMTCSWFAETLWPPSDLQASFPAQSAFQLLLGSLNSRLPDLEQTGLGTATVPGGEVIGMAIRAAAAQCMLLCNRVCCSEGCVRSEGPRW